MTDAGKASSADYPLLPFFGASVLLNPVARAAEHFDVPGAFVGGVIILAAIAVAAIAASVRLVRSHPSRLAWCGLVGWSASLLVLAVGLAVRPAGGSAIDVLAVVSGVVVIIGSFARRRPAPHADAKDPVSPPRPE